ncbi:MAG: galactose oxidase-like domain-containing protein [Phycisphaerales bacterium]
MNVLQCWRAARPQTSSGRYRKAAFAGLATAAIVCGPVAGQPNIDGEWNDPHNTGTLWGANYRAFAMHAVHLPTGSILIWQYPADDSFLWDPVADTLTEIETPANFPIDCSGHAGLPDGTILVAGRTEKTKVFSLGPVPGGPWQTVEDMTYFRFYPTCTTLPDGRVLASSGLEEFGQVVLTPEIFDPGNDPLQGTWEVLGISMNGIGKLYPHMFVVPDDDPNVQKVFFSSSWVALDLDDDEITYMLDIGALTWTAVGGLPPFTGRFGSAVMYEPGVVLKCGGQDQVGGLGFLDRTATIDLTDATPVWILEDSMEFARQMHNLVLLPDGKILAVGGSKSGDPVKDAEWFDPNEPLPIWRKLAAMELGRADHSTAVLLADGRVLSAGSDGGTAEIFSPPYLFWGDPPKIGFAPTGVSYGTNFSVMLSSGSPVPVEEIDKVSFLRLGSTTHSIDMDQRYVRLEFQVDTLQPNALIVEPPANASYAPPGYYMLFLISDDGVPSIAKYVRLTAPITP